MKMIILLVSKHLIEAFTLVKEVKGDGEGEGGDIVLFDRVI